MLDKELPIPFDGDLPLARSGERLSRRWESTAVRQHPVLLSHKLTIRPPWNSSLVVESPERGLAGSMLGTGAKEVQRLVRTGVSRECRFHAVRAELGEDVDDREARTWHSGMVRRGGTWYFRICLFFDECYSTLNPARRARIMNCQKAAHRWPGASRVQRSSSVDSEWPLATRRAEVEFTDVR